MVALPTSLKGASALPRLQSPARGGALVLTGREGAPYLIQSELVGAVNVALTLGLPLLVSGEPGCGKTDLAFALALHWWQLAQHASKAPEPWQPDDATSGLLQCYVRSDSNARDFLYSYDVMRRFSDAQLSGDAHRSTAKDPRNYIELVGLGRALVDAALGTPRVVLVDEIDKAPRDLPNDLLRELDQGRFEIKEIPENLEPTADPRRQGLQPQMGRSAGGTVSTESRPFIVITSNDERHLPPAFLRRCVFHHMTFPDKAMLNEILRRASELEAQDSGGPGPATAATANEVVAVRTAAVEVFLEMRSLSKLRKKPSTGELLRWHSALWAAFGPDERRRVVRWWEARQDDRSGQDTSGANDRKLSWADLPGMGCLVKNAHDWSELKLSLP